MSQPKPAAPKPKVRNPIPVAKNKQLVPQGKPTVGRVPRPNKLPVPAGPRTVTGKSLVRVATGAGRYAAGIGAGVAAAASVVGMGIAGAAYAIRGDRFGKGQPDRGRGPKPKTSSASTKTATPSRTRGPTGAGRQSSIASITKTKGGNYITYKAGSEKAASFRAAYKAAKGKDFSWQGRKYKGK